MNAEEMRTAELSVLRQHLEIVAKHADNYSNGTLGRSLAISELVVDVARNEVREALTILHALGVPS